ncbi:PAS domain S-box protein [Kineosporia sp. NBRC 101731]|uniref:PAS domain S-box protein n=1 Tax=Kineosporia sp. NBRC 101731 TaxID=3032199 RepID=UPI00249FC0E0|nr:PAS domain S-box protein [Kineosporia sp. NBRC 101731]GLY33702.1 hypothetical protein Kisp02_70670 [Kineosporia sp. NBRC 101731]
MSSGKTPPDARSGAGPPATAIVDPSGHIVSTTPTLARMFGFAEHELAGKPLSFLFSPDAHEVFAQGDPADEIRELARAGRTRVHTLTAAGAPFTAEISAITLPGTDGVAIECVRRPPEVSDLSAPLIESAPDGLVIIDPHGEIVMVNAQTERMFGYRRGELTGQKVEILVPLDARPHHEHLREEYLRAPVIRPMAIGKDLHGVRKDGTEFPVDISLSSIRGPGTHLVSAWIRDITERRRVDDELIMLAGIVHSSDDAVLSCTLGGVITSWNRSAERLFGYTAAEVLGRPLSVLVPEDQLRELAAMVAAIKRSERVDVHEGVRIRKDGSVVDVSISMSPIHNQRGTLVGASTVFRDNTRNKMVERHLLAARDAAEASSHAFESFSYSVAHDLRAPLRAIDGFSRFLEEDYSGCLDDQALSHLRHIRASSAEMAQLIEGLLHLAKVSHRELIFVPFDLSVCADRILARLRSAEPERVIETVVQPGAKVHGDPVLLANVLENLLQNAWKFTRGRAAARIEFVQDANSYVVRDNGAGFDMKFSSKLFAVFQRCHTTAEFEGTGVGLASVSRIIERHGGQIWAHGAVGEGAAFHFTLSPAERGGLGADRTDSADDSGRQRPASYDVAGSYSPASSTAAS